MRLPVCAASLAVSLCVCSTSSTGRAADPEAQDTLSKLVQPYLDAGIFSGVSIGCVREGHEPLVVGFGQTGNPKQPVPDGQTVYEIGSISKVFTGILLGHAVAKDEVALQDPVEKLLPEGFSVPGRDRDITLLDLATHSSGLPRLPTNMDAAAADPYAEYDGTKLREFLTSHQLAKAPGRSGEYSNLGFALLGFALAHHAGTDYGQLLSRRITAPLAREDTTVDAAAVDSGRLAVPHDVDLQPTDPWAFRVFAAAGAIRSTVDDMVRFIEANLDPPEGELGKAIELAWTVHRPSSAPDQFALGLGWHIARDGSTRWHNGGTGGYHSSVFINRDKRAGVVVLANTASFEVDVLAEQIAVWAMGGEVEPRAFDAVVEVSDEVKQTYVGRYQHSSGAVMTIALGEAGKLSAQLSGQPAFGVYPESEEKWNYRVVKASLVFESGGEGPSKSLTLHQNGMKLKFERTDEPKAD